VRDLAEAFFTGDVVASSPCADPRVGRIALCSNLSRYVEPIESCSRDRNAGRQIGGRMRALCVIPAQPDSAQLIDVPDPPGEDGSVLAECMAVGICGTDLEIVSGHYGWPPVGRDRLILGHESIGRVLEAPPDSGFITGDLVVGVVRRPDPVPCRFCQAGEWDMCVNGQYTERGIKERDGYASERFRLEPEFAVKVDSRLGRVGVLVEPASVVAKAWDHADRIGARSSAWRPRTALITGAGPIGLLAAMMGRQRNLDVHVFDRVQDGPKPHLVRDLGAVYHGGDLSVLGDLSPDIIMECTGATAVIADAVTRSAPSGIVCLAGVSSGGHSIRFDLGDVNRRMVLENDVIFGSVNANLTHYLVAAGVLARADQRWLSRLITRRVTVEHWREAFVRQPHDVKVVLDFAAGARE
jgi:glucose 1-dehydrogenase